MTGFETLVVDADGPVDWVTLNRPESLNAITTQMIEDLWCYFSRVEKDLSRRVVVLRGAGRAFCAGKDLREPDPPPGRRSPANLPDLIRLMRRCPQPIISLVHGPACGGGFVFALASDIRIAGRSTRMNDAFVKLGLSGCELGISYFLPKMVGLSIASELMFTGRFIDAERALATSLVSQVVNDADLDDAARAIIADMLRTSPMGMRKTKETLNKALDIADLSAVIDLEQQAQIACINSGGDFQEAINAFVEKRDPIFAPEG